MEITPEQRILGSGFTPAEAAEHLHALAHVWPVTKEQPLRWDTLQNVFAGPEPGPSYNAVFGSWWPLRASSRRDKLKNAVAVLHGRGRWVDPRLPRFALPPDTILFPREKTRALVIVSAAHGKVLKIARPEKRLTLEREAAALTMASAAGIGHRAPRLLANGELADGVRWLLTGLADNSDSVDRPVFSRRGRYETWQTWLVDCILPELQRFYDHSGAEVTAAEECAADLAPFIPSHPRAAELQAICGWMNEIAADGPAYIVKAQVHGDLRIEHIHRGSGSWKLIDWGRSSVLSVSRDFFGPLNVPNDAYLNQAFWSWLRGTTPFGSLSGPVQRDVTRYTRWLQDWQGVDANAATARYQLLADVVDMVARRGHGGPPGYGYRELGALFNGGRSAA
jgi:hypothetical protein